MEQSVAQIRYYVALAMLLLCVSFVTGTCMRASVEWIGKPFNGFVMARNRVVLGGTPPRWSGFRAGVAPGAQLVAIDGQPVRSVAEALAAARSAPVGTAINYTFQTSQGRSDVTIPVMLFRAQDYFDLFFNSFFTGFTFLLMGFLVALLRPRLKAAQAFLVVSLTYGLSLIVSLGDFSGYHYRNLYALTRAAAPGAVLYLAATFPVVQSWVGRRSIRTIWLFSILVLAAIDILTYERAPALWFRYLHATDLLFSSAVAVAASLLWLQYRYAPAALAREQIKLVALGATVAFCFPIIAVYAARFLENPLSPRAILSLRWVFPAILAYAIVKRDPLEIDIFLRRATAYVAVTAAVAMLYAGVLAVLSALTQNLRIASSPWFTLLFSLGVLVLIRPTWGWVQNWVDRLFFRTRFDYAEIIESVSHALTRTLSAEEITEHVRRAVAETLSPQSARLYVADEKGHFHSTDPLAPALPLAAETRAALQVGQILDSPGIALTGGRSARDEALYVPLRFEGQLEGVLVLGPKKSAAPYGPRDVELLRTLANQTAIALRNASSYRRVTELLSSLETRVEERTRELQATQAELQASNRKLRELDRFKTRFFSDASHELRTPLSLVIGPLEKLRRQPDLTPEALRLIDLAHGNACKLLVLTDTLLDLSRLDAGRMEPNFQHALLAPLIERTAEPFRWLAEQRGVEFRVAKADPSISLWCDASMFGKILGNLLANALKFTKQGYVEVATLQEGAMIGVRVTDTGPGIPEDELPHIFDRYRQASTAAATTVSGSGLGLALVRELTDLHGGRVEVHSKVGEGTCFTIWLPLPPTDETAVPVAPPSPEVPTISFQALAAAAATHIGSAERPKSERTDETPDVLVVEDNPDMLEFIAEILPPDFQPRCARDSVEAMRLIRERRPDLILSDVMMPGPDGVALCKTIKNDANLRHIPLILLTARASMESKVSGLEAGADDYITKPFYPEELKARISALLRMRSMERELQRSHAELSAAYEELRNTQTQLVQAEKMASLGTLVAGVAHEINNPVAFIRSSIDLIANGIAELKNRLENAASGERSQVALGSLAQYEEQIAMLEQNVAICREGAARAARIVTDLRTFCRPGTGRREQTNLHENLERCLRLLHGEYKNRVTIRREYGSLPPVVCDTGQIGQVFLNLLANALQAIDGTGEVRIRTRQENGCAVIEIEDSGRGMDQRTLERIFDPFFTTKEPGKGTGLGLSISRSLVLAHGGDISVRSTIGRGSTFIVSIPINGATNEQHGNTAAAYGGHPDRG